MNISESRFRQILREEARAVLEEDLMGMAKQGLGTFARGFERGTQAVGAAIGINDPAKTVQLARVMGGEISKLIPEPLKSKLGGPAGIAKAWGDAVTQVLNTSTTATAAPMFVPKLTSALVEMQRTGQITAMVNRLGEAGKGGPEIMKAILDAAVARATAA